MGTLVGLTLVVVVVEIFHTIIEFEGKNDLQPPTAPFRSGCHRCRWQYPGCKSPVERVLISWQTRSCVEGRYGGLKWQGEALEGRTECAGAG